MLLQMAKICPEFKIGHIVESTADLIKLVKKDTPISKDILQHCFYETVHTRKCKEINWNKNNTTTNALKFESTFVDSQTLSSEKALSDGKQDIRKMVDLKLISLRWMFQDGKEFSDLVSEFKKLERPAWFGHEFLVALFKTNW